MPTEPMILIPRRHYDDVVAIAECYEGDSKALKLDAEQLEEVQGYLAEAHAIMGRLVVFVSPRLAMSTYATLPQSRVQWESNEGPK